MDINNQFDKEMLSAYLDDALTVSELAQVEAWLADDPAALDYLNQLRSNRNSLKAIAAVPVVRLKSSFADRVLAQAVLARETAGSTIVSDQVVPDQVVPAKVQLPESIESPRRQPWWAWAALAATAAAVVWLAILPMIRPVADPQALTSGTDKTNDQPGQTELAEHKPAHDLLTDTLPSDLVLSTETMTPSGVTPSGKSVDSSRSTPEERHQRNDLITLQMVFIGEVQLSQSAWDAGKLDELMESYGIRYEKELVASQALIEGLIESKVIAGPAAEPSSRQDAALIYVDCPALALSKLLVSLENDSQDFTGFNYNLAMSGAGIGLASNYDKLLNALQAQTVSSNGRGVARLIVPDRASQELGKLLPQFESVQMKSDKSFAELVAKEFRKGNMPGNESVKLLLIVRKQP